MRRLAVCVAVLATTVGCEDLDDFRTSEGEIFHGPVVGSEPEDAGVEADPGRSFLLFGFESVTQMELRFDPAVAGSAAAERSPGRVDTFICADRSLEPCRPADRTPGPLSDARLQPIKGFAEDVLSQYSFPGGSRIRNYMFHAPLARGDGAGHAMVFVSLMESARIEVRVIAPGDAGAAAGGGPLFGIFRLGRRAL